MQYSGVLSRLLSTSSTVRLLVFLSTLGLETRLYVVISPHARYVFVLFFLSIPNGPAGLLVSVNEEPVHAIGILYFSLCRVEGRIAEGISHTLSHLHSF